MMRTRRLIASCAVMALPIGLVACSDGDDNAGADTDPDGGAEAAAVVDVVAVDFAFEGLPDTVEAGTKLTLRNDAQSELHELVAFRLDDDETRSMEELLELSPGEMQGVLGEPSTVILAPPSSEQAAVPVGDGTLSESGRYAILCMIPTGADPEEYMSAAATSDGPPDVAGGPPHIVHGMYAELTVE